MKTQAADSYINFELGWKPTQSQVALLSNAARVVVGGVICAAGILKVINHESFYRSLTTYGFFSDAMIGLIASVLPHVEATVGLLFLFGIGTRPLGVTIAVMLTSFTLIAGVAFALDSSVDCGCLPLGNQADPIGIGFFVRNALLILSTLWIVKKTGREGD